MQLCSRPRCDFPVAGVGEPYGLCVQHGHEERNRRLLERDAQVRAAAPPAPLRPNLSPTLPRPLSAVVGARPAPVTIQPSAATVAAKEPPVPKPKPMTLAPDADAHPERCRTAGCTLPPHGRGLCNAHVQRAYREGTIDTLGLPSKTPYKAASARKPKAVAPTAPKPTPTAEPRLSREEKQIAEQQAHQEEVAKLRAERDAAIARAERAEKDQHALRGRMMDAERRVADSARLSDDVSHMVNTITFERDAAVARADAAEKAKAELEQAEGDLLDESIEVARALGIDTSGDYDLTARAREVMAELADVRAKFDDASALAFATASRNLDLAATNESLRRGVCEALGIDLDGDADWVLAQLRERIEGAAIANEVAERLRRERAEAVANAESTRNVLDNHIARLAGLTDGICEILGIDQHPSGSISWVLERLRERLEGDADKIDQLKERIAAPVPPPGASLTGRGDLMWLRAERERAEAVERALHESQPWLDAAKECAVALGVTTPEELIEGAKALALDQHPPATRFGLPALPEPKPHRVKQAGGRDLGVLVGHVTESGLFRVTSGPLAGAVYGCLYSAEPVERPELGEPEPGSTVWVCTTIDEVTATHIYTGDGGRFRRSEWGPGRFVRRQAGPTTRIASQPTPTVTDDLPF